MHGYRQEEDGVTVVSPRACTEEPLHGLDYRKQLLCESHDIVKQHLQEDQHSGIRSVQECPHKSRGFFNTEQRNAALQMQVSNADL